MKRNPKTIAVNIIQGNYGYGWDDLSAYRTDERKELKNDYAAYIKNDKTAAHRIITRRIPNPQYVPET